MLAIEYKRTLGANFSMFRSLPKASVWFKELDLFQYSFPPSMLKNLGQVWVARHRWRIPPVWPVSGSVITGKVNGNSGSCAKCRSCFRELEVGWANRKFIHTEPPDPVA